MGQIKSRLQNLLPHTTVPATTGSDVVYVRHQDCNLNIKLFNTTELIAFDQKEKCVSSRLFWFPQFLNVLKSLYKFTHKKIQVEKV